MNSTRNTASQSCEIGNLCTSWLHYFTKSDASSARSDEQECGLAEFFRNNSPRDNRPDRRAVHRSWRPPCPLSRKYASATRASCQRGSTGNRWVRSAQGGFLFSPGRCVCTARDVGAAVHQGLKWFGCRCKQTVLDHPAIVLREGASSIAGRDELRLSRFCNAVADPSAICSFLSKEHRLVPRDCSRKCPILYGYGGNSGLVQAGNVVPVPGETIPAQTCLQAENMDRGGLLPEGSFGMHEARSGRRKL